MGSTARDERLTPAKVILGASYDVLLMLPADPDNAAPQLKLFEDVLTHKTSELRGVDRRVESCAEPSTQKALGTALKGIAVASDLIEGVRPTSLRSSAVRKPDRAKVICFTVAAPDILYCRVTVTGAMSSPHFSHVHFCGGNHETSDRASQSFDTCGLPQQAAAWGDDGHKTIAPIAQHCLIYPISTTKRPVDALLRADIGSPTQHGIASEATRPTATTTVTMVGITTAQHRAGTLPIWR